MKFYKAILFFHDEANDRDDADGVTEGSRQISIKA
jgi:hypothetical protein